MSRRNGDRAKFQKDRKRKLLHRQRIRALIAKQPALQVSGAAQPAGKGGSI